jgi:hypothetical protein
MVFDKEINLHILLQYIQSDWSSENQHELNFHVDVTFEKTT